MTFPEKCNCTNEKCPRHGKCDECVEFHKASKEKPLPFCQREENKCAAVK
ncbi:MAG: hypothetical protein RR846_07015 [Oscillospiraceae bacterium]